MEIFEVTLTDKRTGKEVYIVDAVPANSITDIQNISIDEILNRESHYYWQDGGCGSSGDDGEFMGVIQTIDYLVEQHVILLEVSLISPLNESVLPSTYSWDPTFKR